MRTPGLLCLLLAWSFSIRGQRFHLSHYQDLAGLNGAAVRHFNFDTSGFAWVATDNGLLRFDGRRFTSFNKDVPSQYGHFLLSADEDIYYCHDAGISLIRYDGESATVTSLIPGMAIPGDTTLRYPNRVIAYDDALWISQPDGRIAHWQGEKLRFYTLGASYASGRSDSRFFFFIHEEQLWAVSSAGQLIRYDHKEDQFLTLATGNPVKVIAYQRPFLWLGGRSLRRIKLGRGVILSGLKDSTELAAPITAMTLDETGNLYLGLENKGLYYAAASPLSQLSPRPVFSNNDPHRVDPLPFREITALDWRIPGELWVASKEGLGILQKRFFESVEGLPNGSVNGIALDKGERLYVNYGDLFRVDHGPAGWAPTSIPTRETVNTIAAKGEELMIGTSNGHLLVTDRAGRQRRRFDFSWRGEGIFYLFPDENEQGTWFCQAPNDQPIQGVALLRSDGTLQEYGPEAGLDNRILVIKPDRKGRIYAAGIGSTTYLYRYDEQASWFINLSLAFDFAVSPNFEVHDFAVGDDGIIWLATTDGLLAQDIDRVRKVDLPELPRDVEIRAVVAPSDGGIWLATDTEGLVFWDGERALAMKEESGLPAKIMTYRSLYMDQNDRLWAGTAEGLVFTPQQNPRPLPTPPPKLLGPSGGESFYPEEELMFGLVTPAFHGHQVFYRYRLNGDQWQFTRPDGQVSMSKLEPGDHYVYYQARKEGAFDWSEERQFKFSVRRHWYREPWLPWLTVGLLFVGGGLAYFFKRKKYQERIAQLGAELNRLQNRNDEG